MMRLDELEQNLGNMSVEELEEYMLDTINSIREDFDNAETEAANEQNRESDKISAQ